MSFAPPERSRPALRSPALNGHGEQPPAQEEATAAPAGERGSPPPVPAARTKRDLERLLVRVKQDLAHLPRHEWDNYLWNLCSALVQVHPRAPGHSPASRDDEP